MPSWKAIHQFVSYVQAYNTKDNDEDDAHLVNLVDPNYADIKAIKEDNALRKFNEKYGYGKIKVADLYKSAKHLHFVERRDNNNSTHVQGIAIIVTEEGKEFISSSKILKLKIGKWNAIVQYYKPWSMVIALGSLIVSIVALLAVFLK